MSNILLFALVLDVCLCSYIDCLYITYTVMGHVAALPKI